MLSFKIEDINNVNIYTPGLDTKLSVNYKRQGLVFIPFYKDTALKDNDNEAICNKCGDYYDTNKYDKCPFCDGSDQEISEKDLIDYIYWVLDDSPENIVVINGIQIP